MEREIFYLFQLIRDLVQDQIFKNSSSKWLLFFNEFSFSLGDCFPKQKTVYILFHKKYNKLIFYSLFKRKELGIVFLERLFKMENGNAYAVLSSLKTFINQLITELKIESKILVKISKFH